MKYAYVFGNDWQMNHVTFREVEFLNKQEYVFCMNLYPQHWHRIGIMPTHWVLTDTFGEGLSVLEQQLKTFVKDKLLLKRLQHTIVCVQTVEALDIIHKYTPLLFNEMTFTTCKLHRETTQFPPARSLSTPLYNFGSSITTTINAAWVISHFRPIKLFGCGWNNNSAHFYDESPFLGNRSVGHIWKELWFALDLFHEKYGVHIIDCNPSGTKRLQTIPRSTIIDDDWEYHPHDKFSCLRYSYDTGLSLNGWKSIISP